MIKRIGALVFAFTLLFAFAVPASAAVPSGYTQLEYIESSGSQYIDTGIYPSQNTRVVADMEYVSFSDPSCGLFGSSSGSGSTYEVYYYKGNYTFAFGTNFTASGGSPVGQRMSIDVSSSGGSFDVGGTVYDVSPSASTFSVSNSLYIHGLNRGSSVAFPSSTRTYSFKIYDNGSLVRDFIPVKNSSGEIGLFDNVTSSFYGNVGSGSFAAGSAVDDGGSGGGSDVPDGYTFYEYLESDGSASSFIITDLRPDGDTGFWLDGQFLGPTSNDGYVFGEQGPNLNNKYSLMVTLGMGNEIIVTKGGNSVAVEVDDPLSRMIISLDADGSYSVDGHTGSLTSSAFTAVNPLYIFSLNASGTATDGLAYRIYSLKFYSGDSLVRDYYAAKNPDGVLGVYDLIDGNFLPASDSSSIGVGSEIIIAPDEPSVADRINDLNTQIHDIEQTIYDDLHTYSAQVDPSTATNFSGNFLSAMSFISDTWTSAYNQLGDMQVIVTFPLFLAIAMLFIGRMNSVIASGAMKSRKNNDKKGGGDVG